MKSETRRLVKTEFSGIVAVVHHKNYEIRQSAELHEFEQIEFSTAGDKKRDWTTTPTQGSRSK